MSPEAADQHSRHQFAQGWWAWKRTSSSAGARAATKITRKRPTPIRFSGHFYLVVAQFEQ